MAKVFSQGLRVTSQHVRNALPLAPRGNIAGVALSPTVWHLCHHQGRALNTRGSARHSPRRTHYLGQTTLSQYVQLLQLAIPVADRLSNSTSAIASQYPRLRSFSDDSKPTRRAAGRPEHTNEPSRVSRSPFALLFSWSLVMRSSLLWCLSTSAQRPSYLSHRHARHTWDCPVL